MFYWFDYKVTIEEIDSTLWIVNRMNFVITLLIFSRIENRALINQAEPNQTLGDSDDGGVGGCGNDNGGIKVDFSAI